MPTSFRRGQHSQGVSGGGHATANSKGKPYQKVSNARAEDKHGRLTLFGTDRERWSQWRGRHRHR